MKFGIKAWIVNHVLPTLNPVRICYFCQTWHAGETGSNGIKKSFPRLHNLPPDREYQLRDTHHSDLPAIKENGRCPVDPQSSAKIDVRFHFDQCALIAPICFNQSCKLIGSSNLRCLPVNHNNSLDVLRKT